MPKRASLDTDQFKVTLPSQPRDPLDSLIPTTPLLQQPEKKKGQTANPLLAPPSDLRQSRYFEDPKKVHHRTSKKVHYLEGAPVQRRTSAPRSEGRQKKKQGFQVYVDQAVSLAELQFQQFQKTGIKPDIGEFVRQALDDFIQAKKRELER